MKYSIQGNLIDTCPTVTPSMYITCRSCNTAYLVSGQEIPCDEDTNIIAADIESSIDQTLTKRGWQDCICNYCQDIDPNIVEKYNDAEDRHED